MGRIRVLLFALHLIHKRCVHVVFISFFITRYSPGGCRPTTEREKMSEKVTEWESETGMIYLNEIVLPGIWLNSISLFPQLAHSHRHSLDSSITQHLDSVTLARLWRSWYTTITKNDDKYLLVSVAVVIFVNGVFSLKRWTNNLPSDGIFFWCQYDSRLSEFSIKTTQEADKLAKKKLTPHIRHMHRSITKENTWWWVSKWNENSLCCFNGHDDSQRRQTTTFLRFTRWLCCQFNNKFQSL